MIPADHIKLGDDQGSSLDGTTAWWVVDPADVVIGVVRMADRPCDTCDGRKCVENFSVSYGWDACPDCRGSGRHCFGITVGGAPILDGRPLRVPVTLTVSVVEGMVLPIVDAWQSDEPMIFHDPTSPVAQWWHTHATPDGFNVPIDLPSAAAPNMFAINLKVHNAH